MLLYYRTTEDDLPRLRTEGLRTSSEGLHNSLSEAWTGNGAVLVVDGAAVGMNGRAVQAGEVALAPSAFLNLDPYRPPRPLEAAGGYVARSDREGPELLLIYRRDVWDLPKGKRDEGETVEACALREVREEVGVRRLVLLDALGQTVHGYPEGDAFLVKTTYWFLMTTEERSFTPQAEEDIEAVRWFAWTEAGRRLGYDTLRRHSERWAHVVREAWEGGRLA